MQPGHGVVYVLPTQTCAAENSGQRRLMSRSRNRAFFTIPSFHRPVDRFYFFTDYYRFSSPPIISRSIQITPLLHRLIDHFSRHFTTLHYHAVIATIDIACFRPFIAAAAADFMPAVLLSLYAPRCFRHYLPHCRRFAFFDSFRCAADAADFASLFSF